MELSVFTVGGSYNFHRVGAMGKPIPTFFHFFGPSTSLARGARASLWLSLPTSAIGSVHHSVHSPQFAAMGPTRTVSTSGQCWPANFRFFVERLHLPKLIDAQ